MLNLITPLILTFNEAPNIGRTLQQLTWARRIVVVDSFSSDETLAIAQRFSQVAILQRAFDSFAEQCNFGLRHILTPWVLSLDADYVLSDPLIQEIHALRPGANTAGFQALFQYWVCGRPLRASLYPPRTVLYRASAGHYTSDGHGHRVTIAGDVARLKGLIYHDDRKPLSRWLRAQDEYAKSEAQKLANTPSRMLPVEDRIRSWIVPAPFLILFYTLIIKRALLDGPPGWLYALQRMTAEAILSMRLTEEKLRDGRVLSNCE